MKKRFGFVSNSSSSSFVCDVCGTVEAGMDACASDFDMTYFSCGHTVCNDEFSKDLDNLTLTQKRSILDERDFYDFWNKAEKQLYPEISYSDMTAEQIEACKNKARENLESRPDSFYLELDWEGILEESDEVPSAFCPVCSLEHISKETVLSYLVSTQNIDVTEIKGTIREKYKNLDDLKKDLK